MVVNVEPASGGILEPFVIKLLEPFHHVNIKMKYVELFEGKLNKVKRG